MSKTVVVTGARGFVGSALAVGLADRGHVVRALSRRGEGSPAHGVTHHRFELAEPIDPRILERADVLVHAAWDVSPPAPKSAQLNVAASGAIARACHEAGVRTVFLSSFAAHDDAVSSYGKAKADAEDLFSGADNTTLRPGLVAGKGGLFARLADQARTRRLVPVIGGSRELQLVGIDDLVSATDRVIDSQLAGAYWLAYPNPVTMRRLVSLLAQGAGRPSLAVPFPEQAALAIALAAEKIGVTTPVSSDSVRGLMAMRTRETAGDLELLGVAPLDPGEVIARYAVEVSGRR